MKSALEDAPNGKIGVVLILQVKRTSRGKSHEIKCGVSYHKRKRDMGMLFNYCPWCSGDLRWWPKEDVKPIEKKVVTKPSLSGRAPKGTAPPRTGSGKLVDRRHLQRGAHRASARA